MTPGKVHYGNLLLSLSDAIDLARPSIAQHQQRTAYIAWRLCEVGRLDEDAKRRIFIAALFHDIGAIPEEQSHPSGEIDSPADDAHSRLGSDILEGHPLFADVAPLVRWHHRPWYQWEKVNPGPLEREAQVLYLADLVERLTDRNSYILHQVEGISSRLAPLVGVGIGAELYQWFDSLARREEFWLALADSRLYSLLLRDGPLSGGEVDLDTVEQVSELARDIIDLKSPFTSSHTSGVSRCAELIARSGGAGDDATRDLRIAGNLHDIGKLAVPNALLDKPGPLTKDEFAVMKSHAFYTWRTLNSIGGLGGISTVASSHHEKLDSSGYPFHKPGAEIQQSAKLLTVADILTALVEDRPYRTGMTAVQTRGVLDDMVGKRQIDVDAVRAAVRSIDEVRDVVTNPARRRPARMVLSVS